MQHWKRELQLEKLTSSEIPEKKGEAIEYFKQALLEDPQEIDAWMWISQLVDDRPTMKYCYRRVLEIEPDNFMAKQFLGFINETDANLKFFPDPPSPLQTYFENQQKSSRPMQMRNSFPEPAPNMRHSIVQSQNSRPVRPQTKEKKDFPLDIFVLSIHRADYNSINNCCAGRISIDIVPFYPRSDFCIPQPK